MEIKRFSLNLTVLPAILAYPFVTRRLTLPKCVYLPIFFTREDKRFGDIVHKNPSRNHSSKNVEATGVHGREVFWSVRKLNVRHVHIYVCMYIHMH